MQAKAGAVQKALRTLTDELGDIKVVSSGANYEKSRDIWNAAVNYRPQIIVLCESASDVRAAVLAARRCEVSFSVRGGGHDWAGRSIRGEIVADLTRMREVIIEGLVATVGGGALSIDVAEAASASGLTAVTGIIGSVGMAG